VLAVGDPPILEFTPPSEIGTPTEEEIVENLAREAVKARESG
jgi:hypothetical protein